MLTRRARYPELASELVAMAEAHRRWLVAQHADLDNDLRRGWLPLVRQAVADGEADPRHFACLADRVAVVDGAPQVYGTVVALGQEGLLFPHPVGDPAGLTKRRAGIGLPPLEAELPFLSRGDIIPFGPDRPEHPLFRWPADAK